MKSARLIASGKQGLTSVLSWHIMFVSVVAVGKIEQINESPSRFTTRGQQIVASPIVAASKGTGMIYRTYQQRIITATSMLRTTLDIPCPHDQQQAVPGWYQGI